MILVDYSSVLHRMIHSSVAVTKPKTKDGKFITSEFINFTKHLIIQELFSVKQEHENTYGNMIICLDNAKDGYWRKDFYPGYKNNRSKARDETEINFKEVFRELNKLTKQLILNLPWKVFDVPRAEADDLILVLAREFSKNEKVLIYSPDKDFIQSQRETKNVHQYSPKTKKWIYPENKHENMEDWILEHICLGDTCDGVPKITDHTEFSENFIEYLKQNNITIDNPFDFKNSRITNIEKRELLQKYDIYKVNRKGEKQDEKDVFKTVRFGHTTLQKAIKKHKSLDNWLDSHPLYRKHYDRNFTLVMEEGIPIDIWNEIIIRYKEAKTDYNNKEFEDYLKQNDLSSIIMNLPSVFKIDHELNADDFDWV